MSNVMWYVGSSGATPLDESSVRATVEPVRTDDEGSELQHAPEWNAVETDQSPQLKGLSPRGKGSDTVDTQKSVPWWIALASQNHESPISDQIASSGTAARREEQGQVGHGTMQYAIGIEPLIRDGAAFGNDYFVTHDRDIQEGAGNYMSPDESGQWLNYVAAANAARSSRQAYQATLYKNLYA